MLSEMLEPSPTWTSTDEFDVNAWASTRKRLHRTRFRWTLHHFSFHVNSTGKYVKSPVFRGAEGANGKPTQWRLDLYPHGDARESSDYLSVYLQRVCDTEAQTMVRFSIDIVDQDGRPADLRDSTDPGADEDDALHTFEGKSASWGYSKFVRRSRLLEQRRRWLARDTLTLVCRMEVALETVHTCGLGTSDPTEPRDSRRLDVLGRLFGDTRFTDVSFIVEGREFTAHKAVLSAACPLFATMFDNEEKKEKKDQVDRLYISGVSANAFQEVLRFVYTGVVEQLDRYSVDLLIAAIRYQLPALQLMCQARISADMDIHNCVKVLIVADLHSVAPLKASAVRFIDQHAADVLQTDAWNVMVQSYPHLLADLYRQRSRVSNT